MIITTTPTIEGRPISKYHGIVTGEAILGANVFRDLFASITDIIGGRSGAYEQELGKARKTALGEMEDAARAMGVDVLIVVDVGFPLRKRDSLESVATISNQMLAILIRRGSDAQLKALAAEDVLLQPELGEASSFDFEVVPRAAAAPTSPAAKACIGSPNAANTLRGCATPVRSAASKLAAAKP